MPLARSLKPLPLPRFSPSKFLHLAIQTPFLLTAATPSDDRQKHSSTNDTPKSFQPPAPTQACQVCETVSLCFRPPLDSRGSRTCYQLAYAIDTAHQHLPFSHPFATPPASHTCIVCLLLGALQGSCTQRPLTHRAVSVMCSAVRLHGYHSSRNSSV